MASQVTAVSAKLVTVPDGRVGALIRGYFSGEAPADREYEYHLLCLSETEAIARALLAIEQYAEEIVRFPRPLARMRMTKLSTLTNEELQLVNEPDGENNAMEDVKGMLHRFPHYFWDAYLGEQVIELVEGRPNLYSSLSSKKN